MTQTFAVLALLGFHKFRILNSKMNYLYFIENVKKLVICKILHELNV